MLWLQFPVYMSLYRLTISTNIQLKEKVPTLKTFSKLYIKKMAPTITMKATRIFSAVFSDEKVHREPPVYVVPLLK